MMFGGLAVAQKASESDAAEALVSREAGDVFGGAAEVIGYLAGV